MVAFPRHADEAGAALQVATQFGVPLHLPGRRHLHRGQLGRRRHRAGLLPAHEPGAVGGCAGPDRGRRTGATLDDITAAAAASGCGSAPIRPPTRGPASAARSATTPAARGRCGTAAQPTTWSSLDVLTGSGDAAGGAARGRGGLAARRPDRRRARRPGRGAPGPDPHRVRPVPPAGLRLLPGASAAGERRGPGPVPGRHRGHARHRHQRDGLAGALAEGGGAGRARLRQHAGRRGHGARPAAAPAGGHRGHRRAAGRRLPGPPGAAAVPALPRGEAWLFVETAGDTEAEARAAADRLIGDAGCLDALVVTGAAAAALWRIREDGAGLGGRTPAGEPAWPGWEDAAVPPQHLGAYLRDFGALMREHGLDGLTYGHFGDGCVHVRIDFPFSSAPGAIPVVRRRRRAAGRAGTAARCRRARRRPGAQRAARLHVLARGPRRLRRGQGHLRPGQRAQSRRAGRSGAARRRPAGADGPPDPHAASVSPIRTTAATCPPPCTAAPASASAGPTPPPAAGSCARPTWLPGTRRTPPAAARASCRSSRTAPGQGLRLAGGSRGAGAVPVVQGLLVGLPGRRGHGDLQGRGAVPALPAAAASAGSLRAGLAAPLGRPGRPRAGLANAALGRRPWPGRPSGSAASTPAARCRASPPAPSATGSPAVPPRRGPRSCCGSTRSPTISPPRSARPRSACWRPPGTRCGSPRSRCAAG